MWQRFKPYVISVAAALAVGGLSSLASGNIEEAYSSIIRPPLAPPGWIFPVVWLVLFILMGIAAAIVWEEGKADISKQGDAKGALGIYALQLAVNFFWPVAFFRLEWRLFAFFWLLILIALVLAVKKRFTAINKTAGALLIPYILWLLFAAYLNIAVYILNG